ncbi:MAG: hypothetical protein WCG06_01900 [Candidatus Omnitrophota bacterium]
MMKQMVNALIRHALTGVGAAMVTHGYTSADQAQAIIGGIMAAVSVYMSYRNKKSVMSSSQTETGG